MKKIILLAFAIPLSICAMESSNNVESPAICQHTIYSNDFTQDEKQIWGTTMQETIKKAAQSAQENNISLPKEFYQIKQYVEHLETTELEQTPTGLSTIDGIDWRTNRFLKKPSEAERNALNEWKEIMEKIASNDSFASLEGDLILLEINLMRIKSMAKADLERVNDFWNNHPTFMQSSNLHKQSSNSHQKLLFICGGTGILIVCASIIAYKIYKVIKKNQHSKNRMQAQSIAS